MRFLHKANANGTKCDLFQNQNILKGIEFPSCGLVKTPKYITFARVEHSVHNSVAHR